MFVLVTYDIDMCTGKADAKRLRNVAKYCERFGVRVQNSVFEMNLDYTQFRNFKNELSTKIDAKRDSVRYYILGNSPDNHVETSGVNDILNVREALIF